MSKRGRQNFGNRLGNTIVTPVRTVGVPVNTAVDLANTLISVPKDALKGLSNTLQNTRDSIYRAFTEGKRYHKALNIPLSPFVALGTAVEGTAKTTLNTIGNTAVNTWNTLKNTATNIRRSTFGRVFSKKPISDFSYDKLKTADVINTEKTWIGGWRFGKGKSNKKSTDRKKGESTETKTQSATAGIPVSVSQDISTLKQNQLSLNQSIETLKKQLSESQNESKKLIELLKNEKMKATKDNKDEKKSDKDMILSTGQGKSAEQKEGKKDNGEATKSSEKKTDEKAKKVESNTDTNDKSKETIVDKELRGKENDIEKAKILLGESKATNLLNKLEKNQNLKIIFDENTDIGKIVGNTKTIHIGTKFPTKSERIAPLNWEEKNQDEQIKHVLLHELSHIVANSRYDDAKKGYDTIERLSKGTLFPISGEYGKDDRSKEDLAELLALYIQGNKFDKYLKMLQGDNSDDANFRNRYNITKISKQDADELKKVCEDLWDHYA